MNDRIRAYAVHRATGLSMPVAKVLARWGRSELGVLWAAYDRAGRMPKLLRRAQRALRTEGTEEERDWAVYAEGPAGRWYF